MSRVQDVNMIEIQLYAELIDIPSTYLGGILAFEICPGLTKESQICLRKDMPMPNDANQTTPSMDGTEISAEKLTSHDAALLQYDPIYVLVMWSKLGTV
jgi:hypothetical protein